MDLPSTEAFWAAATVPGLSLLLDSAAKGLAVLAAAALVCLCLGRASAAARHLVWSVAFVALLALPFLNVSLPTWCVIANLPSSEAALPHGTAAPHSAAPGPPAAPPTAVPAAPPVWPQWIAALWLLVAVVLLVRVGVGLILAWRFTRRAALVEDPALTEMVQQLARTAGIGRPVALRCSRACEVPLALGLLRPVVLLPADARDWPEERLRAALRHELSHIRRGDYVWQALAAVACALHWFDPLAWLAAWRLRTEAERACDDAVLAAGVGAADYAGHLLGIASRLNSDTRVPAASVAMAQRPQIEGRLRAILARGLSRRGLTRRRLLGAFVLGLVGLIPLATLRTSARDDAQTKARGDAYRLTSLSNLRQIGLAVVVYAQDHGGRLPDADHWMDQIAPPWPSEQFAHSLLHDPGAPNLPYGYAFNRALSGGNLATLKDPSSTVMIFESTAGTRNAADNGASVPHPGRHEGGTTYVFADGRARWVPDGEPVSFAVGVGPVPSVPTVRGTAAFRGRVVSEDGRPAAGVHVGAQIQNDAMLALLALTRGEVMLPSGVDLPAPAGTPAVTERQVSKSFGADAVTGPEGTYTLTGLTDAPYNIAVWPRDLRGPYDPDAPVAAAIEGARGVEGKTTPVPDLVLTSGGLVVGTVTDAQGQPVAGVGVGSYGPHRPASSAMIIATQTDAAGHYRLRVAPGRSRIYIADSAYRNAASDHPAQTYLDVAKGETKTADFQVQPRPAGSF